MNFFSAAQRKWPEISKILEKEQEEIKSNEEKIFWSGEIEFPDGGIEIAEIKIKNRKLGSGRNLIGLWAWPRDGKYYEKK